MALGIEEWSNGRPENRNGQPSDRMRSPRAAPQILESRPEVLRHRNRAEGLLRMLSITQRDFRRTAFQPGSETGGVMQRHALPRKMESRGQSRETTADDGYGYAPVTVEWGCWNSSARRVSIKARWESFFHAQIRSPALAYGVKHFIRQSWRFMLLSPLF